jgi:hypothetical protein
MKKILLIFFILFSTNIFAQSTFKVAILGDSRSDGEEGTDGINKSTLTKICSLVKMHSPDAVFFTGDLTLGLEKEDEEEEENNIKGTVKGKDIYENHWEKEGFVYNSAHFKNQLNTFSGIIKSTLGDIPFYPLIGNHEAVGPDAISIFKDHFEIKNIAPIDSMHLAYTVKINNAMFVILATDYYSRTEDALVEHTLTTPQVDWLDSLLITKADFKYKFVLGHEPAFSVRGKFSEKPVGLDKYPEARNLFWDILKDNNVNAYFCAHEHLYYRSVDDGLLQVISGGAGAGLEKTYMGFYHFMIMEFSENSPPKVTVIDIDENIKDKFLVESK